MIKLNSVGMIPIAKSYPDIKAHTEIPYGYFFTLDGKKTAAPTDDTKKGNMQCIALNVHNGADEYTDAPIPAGAFVNGYLLKVWEGQSLVFDDSHITYTGNQTYANLNVGATLGINTGGKLEIITDTDGYGLYFVVVDKPRFCGNGVEARIMLDTSKQ